MRKFAYFLVVVSVLLLILVFYLYGFKAGMIAAAAVVFAFLFAQAIQSSEKSFTFFHTKKDDAAILDSTILSDPRCIDIIASGFLGYKFIIPKNIIEEFQKKASSGDEKLKNEARRGLDIIARLRENEEINVRIEKPVSIENPTGLPIIDMAKKFSSKVITCNYEVTKVGLINGVKVLNINDLQLSLRQSFLPGDNITIFILKEGKDKNQGVGYLDDGTMVVVENGSSYIGKRVEVTVQSVLKNPNGKIIFTKIK